MDRRSTDHSNSYLYPWGIVSLMATALVIAGILALVTGAPDWFNDKKSFEITLQFLFVAVLGGGIALFYRNMENRRAEKIKDQERIRERIETEQTALQEFRQTLIETYHSAKKLRRTLRAVSFLTRGDEEYGCEREQFERLMDQMEEVQLRAEALAAEVDSRHDLFGTKQDKQKLYDLLKGAERYLRELLRYYEDEYEERRALKTTDTVRLSSALTTFIGRGKNDDTVMKRYYIPMDEARKLVVALIEQTTPSGSDRAEDGR
jgi:hypothetical protein